MDETLLGHLAALRRSLLRAAAGVAALLLPGFLAAPAATRALVRWAVPERLGALHYFAPLEAFRAQLHVGFVLALAAAWPWVALQAWAFVRPGLREEEARALRRWIPLSTLLFLGGALFACGAVMPLAMAFAASFAEPGLAPVIGLGAFLRLAGSLGRPPPRAPLCRRRHPDALGAAHAARRREPGPARRPDAPALRARHPPRRTVRKKGLTSRGRSARFCAAFTQPARVVELADTPA